MIFKFLEKNIKCFFHLWIKVSVYAIFLLYNIMRDKIQHGSITYTSKMQNDKLIIWYYWR